MVASSDDHLLNNTAVAILITHLRSLATALTPSIPEALSLLNKTADAVPNNDHQGWHLCRELLDLDCQSEHLKGGYQSERLITDYWLILEQRESHSAADTVTNDTQGTDCTLPSAIALI